MLHFLYFKSPRMEAEADARAHFNTLTHLLGNAPPARFHELNGNGIPSATRHGILYCFGHSEPDRGFEMGQGNYLGPEAFLKLLPTNPLDVPKLVFFNTCDSLASGFVKKALSKGVSAVIYSHEKILIKDMAQSAENFFRRWVASASTVKLALSAPSDFPEPVKYKCIGRGEGLTCREVKRPVRTRPVL